jgi:hypothetical protein
MSVGKPSRPFEKIAKSIMPNPELMLWHLDRLAQLPTSRATPARAFDNLVSRSRGMHGIVFLVERQFQCKKPAAKRLNDAYFANIRCESRA